jgi:signal transduction histidine kinase
LADPCHICFSGLFFTTQSDYLYFYALIGRSFDNGLKRFVGYMHTSKLNNMYRAVVNPIVFILLIWFNLVLATLPLLGENHSATNSSNTQLLEKAKLTSKISLDSALAITNEIYQTAVFSENIANQIQALILLSELNFQTGNESLAQEQAEKANQLAESTNDYTLKAKAKLGLSILAYLRLEYHLCLKYNFEALTFADKARDIGLKRFILRDIAREYTAINDFENAHRYLNKAISLGMNTDTVQLYGAYSLKGNIFLKEQKYDSAFYYYLEAKKLAKDLHESEIHRAAAHELMAKYYITIKDLDSAKLEIAEAIKLYSLADNIERVANAYTLSAHVYTLVNDYQSALLYNKKALDLRKQYGSKNLIISSLNNIGGNLLTLKMYDSALVYYQKGLDLESKFRNDFYAMELNKHLFELFLQLGEYKQALQYYQQYSKHNESYNKAKSHKLISEIRIGYELEKEKNRVNELQLEQLKNRQLLLFIGIFGLLAFSLMLFIRIREKRRDNQKLWMQNRTIKEQNRKLDEAITAIKINERRYMVLAENIPGIVFRLQLTPNHKMNFYNDRFFEVTGYSDDEFKRDFNSSLDRMILPEDLPMVQQTRHEALQYSDSYNITYRFIHQGSHVKYFNEIGKSVPEPQIGTQVIDGLIFDVTNSKISEQELVIARDQAKESDRLKSTFLSTISHELRTPLNAIIGFSNLINIQSTQDEINEYLEIIKGSGDHLLELVEDLFDISLIETNNVTVHPSYGKVMESLHLVEGLIRVEKQRQSKTDVDIYLNAQENNSLILFTDHRKLKQILINLLKNALKFTPKGRIDFGFTQETEGGSPFYRFFVKDTGIGIPQSKLNVIFDVFRQADDSDTRLYQGIGIGLSVAKRYVELLGGRIWVDTALGRGSCFYFTLPDTHPETAKPDDTLSTVASLRPETLKTVLIAEDMPSAFNLLKILLEKEGFKTIWAKNGRQAVDYCQTLPDIQLVLMDLKMPDMSGFDAVKIIKESFPNMPVVAQTAFAVEGDKEKILASGFDGYLEKPIQKDKLMDIIFRLLNKS